MFVWSKFASATERDFWELRLQSLEDSSLVISDAPGRRRLKVDAYCQTRKAAENLKKQFGGRVTALKNQDWVAISGRSKLPPLKIRDCLLVCEERDSAALDQLRDQYPSRHVISIPAEMAFGTGQHATTSTCLRMLVDISRQLPKGKWRMLDLGAGSGVLAIASRILGARSAVGFDLDPVTIDIAKRNAETNGVDQVRFTRKDVTQWQPKQQFDCIAANIFFDVLIESFPAIHRALKAEGYLVLSGILNKHADECLNAAEATGLRLQRVVNRGKWVTALARRSS